MEDTSMSDCAYCGDHENDWNSVLSYKCDMCGKYVHSACIRSAQPSPLLHDTFFSFKCENCGDKKKEKFERTNISWHNVVLLTLYNLHKTGQGKCGFFHWKNHICLFIENHWTTFFGLSRKKTNLWLGTVAGTLSSGCPQTFTSGAKVVEQGYWQLTVLGPPLPRLEKKKSSKKKSQATETPIELLSGRRKCRRSAENSLAAAIQLKEKRTNLVGNKKKKQTNVAKDEQTCQEVSPSPRRNQKTTNKPSASLSGSGSNAGNLNASSDIFGGMCISDDSNSVPSSELSMATTSSFSSSLQFSPKDGGYVQQDMECVAPIFSHEIEVDVAVEENEDDDDDLDIDIGSMGVMPDGIFDLQPASPDISDIFNIERDSTSISCKSPPIAGDSYSFIIKQESQPMEEGDFATTNSTSISCKSPPIAGDSYSCIIKQEPQPVEEGDFATTSYGLILKQEAESDVESEGPCEHNVNEGEEYSSQNEEEGVGSEEDVSKMGLPANGELMKGTNKGRPRKRRRLDDAQPAMQPPRLKRVSVFEEGELLQKLNLIASKQTLKPELAQLRRKLICNQTNREFGLPVFDLEMQMEKFAKMESLPSEQSTDNKLVLPKPLTKSNQYKETRDLDRFMMHSTGRKNDSRSYTSFHQRLVGLEDHELKPVVSPYTTRVLLPFIWRNFNPSRKPLKLKLLQEVQAYPHRNDSSWVAPPCPPIDYCYVRAEHIPSVNALCREHFWPGIDMSECLQYPDFSCVVLYRKIVIAFAFMVPDRGYNEAYISFIFTHPEWRGAGIATFMLYHLIQTCMGKDVLLHVSITNPAMLLYQKFGFKCQEVILNFYHKYFPLNCKDSNHAFLMRLSR